MKASLATRLSLGSVAVIAAVLVSAWLSQNHLAQAEAAADRLSGRSIQALALASQLETLMHEKSYVSNYLLSGDANYLVGAQAHYQDLSQWIDGMHDFARNNAEHRLVDDMRHSYLAYVQEGDRVIQFEQHREHAQALASFFIMKNEAERLLNSGKHLFELEMHDMQARRAEVAATIAGQRRLMFAITAAGSVLSLAMGLLLARSALRPIYRLVVRLGESGAGQSGETSHDELSALEAQVIALIERSRQQERSLARAAKLSEFGEIAAELAHEILNPVAGVKAMLQALQRAPVPPEELGQELADMQRDLGRVEAIIRRLMNYARPLEPHVAHVPICEVIDNAATAVRRHPSAQGHPISIAPVPAALAWVLDPGLIGQVLINLLINACEASPPAAAIEVDCNVVGNNLRLRVRDYGVGLTPQVSQRLFHPFFTTKSDGNGLGLAVSRNIILEHAGSLTATPAPDGSGAVFEITLPPGANPCLAPSLS